MTAALSLTCSRARPLSSQFCEFVTLIAHKMKDDSDMQKGDRLSAAFSVFDSDNSGFIDAQEMRRMMYNLGENVSLEQVDEVLGHFDENGDGQISPEEFAKALLNEEMLGTEAMKSK